MTNLQKEIAAVQRRAFVPKLVAQIYKSSPLLELLIRDAFPPTTRWQRFKNRIRNYRERVVLAWRVLRGDDIFDGYDS